jgi:hypothetical protein
MERYLMYKSSHPIISSSENRLQNLLDKFKTDQSMAGRSGNASPFFLKSIHQSETKKERYSDFLESKKKIFHDAIPQYNSLIFFPQFNIEGSEEQKITQKISHNSYEFQPHDQNLYETKLLQFEQVDMATSKLVIVPKIDQEVQTTNDDFPKISDDDRLPEANLHINVDNDQEAHYMPTVEIIQDERLEIARTKLKDIEFHVSSLKEDLPKMSQEVRSLLKNGMNSWVSFAEDKLFSHLETK